MIPHIFILFRDIITHPCPLHETPNNFGKENSQAIMGKQMACAYIGSILMPPVFGLIAENINISLYPIYLLLFAVIMIIMSEKMNSIVMRNQNKLAGREEL